MSLLDTASLIVTPNGYKASKLYSIVPSDGTGDMTFSRTGNTATRVNSSGIIETVNANIPRLDYLGSTCPKLLLEPQRTNLLTYTTSIGDSNTTKTNLTATSDSSVFPDGNTNGFKITGNAGNSTKYISKTYITSTIGTYTLSYFVKYVDEQYLVLRLNDQTGNNSSRQSFDILNGTLNGSIINEGTAVGSNAKIEAYANGWYRISFTVTVIGVISQLQCQCWLFNYTSTTKTTSFLVYGAQLEVGSFATLYIPTTTASVTRNVDSGSKTAISSLIGSTEGTIFCQLQALANYSDFSRISISDATQNNKISIGYSSTNTIQAVLSVAGSVIVNFNTNGISITNNNKIAFKYKLNSFTLFVNGVSIATLSSGAIFSASTLTNIYFTDGNGSSFPIYGKLSSLALWKTALSDSECVTLTTL